MTRVVNLCFKTVLLLTLASAKHDGNINALAVHSSHIKFGPRDVGSVTAAQPCFPSLSVGTNLPLFYLLGTTVIYFHFKLYN